MKLGLISEMFIEYGNEEIALEMLISKVVTTCPRRKFMFRIYNDMPKDACFLSE